MGCASEANGNSVSSVPFAMTPRRRLGEILMDAGVLTEAELEHAMLLQRESGERLGSILVSQGLVDEEVMLSALETQLGIPRVHLARYIISPDVAQLVPEMFARTNRVFPIERTENHLTIAMADPLDIFAMDDVRIMTGGEGMLRDPESLLRLGAWSCKANPLCVLQDIGSSPHYSLTRSLRHFGTHRSLR
jgi:hypothetical protein